MKARATAAGHAMHPVLIVFPLGLLSTAVVFDVLRYITDDDRYATASFFAIAAGLIGGVVAAATGVMDWLKIPQGTRAKRLGLVHGAGNDLVLLLFLASWLLRLAKDTPEHQPNALAFLLGLVGLGIAGVTGWMGSELVERLGMGVHRGANLDAPSSLRAKEIDLRESELTGETWARSNPR